MGRNMANAKDVNCILKSLSQPIEKQAAALNCLTRQPPFYDSSSSSAMAADALADTAATITTTMITTNKISANTPNIKNIVPYPFSLYLFPHHYRTGFLPSL